MEVQNPCDVLFTVNIINVCKLKVIPLDYRMSKKYKTDKEDDQRNYVDQKE